MYLALTICFVILYFCFTPYFLRTLQKTVEKTKSKYAGEPVPRYLVWWFGFSVVCLSIPLVQYVYIVVYGLLSFFEDIFAQLEKTRELFKELLKGK